MRTRGYSVGILLAAAGCYVQPPPQQYNQPPPQQTTYVPPAQTYTPPPQPVYSPPPQPAYQPPPPQPQYEPPEAGGTYVSIDEVPPEDSAPSVDVFYNELQPYPPPTNDPRYAPLSIPHTPP